MGTSFNEKVRLGNSKRTMAKLGRMFEAELIKGERKITRREETLPPTVRTPYTFKKEGLLVTVYLSDGQIINKHKAFKRFCEERGGYSEAIRLQNMMEEKPKETEVNDEYRIIK